MKLQCHLDNKIIKSRDKSLLLTALIKPMENLQKYLSTAPVLLTLLLTFTAGMIIEINRFFPDTLGFYF